MPLYAAQYQAIQRGLTATFRKEAKAASPFFPRVCTVVPSKGADESYGWVGDLPGMREWLGERKFKQLRSAGFTLANKHWESSLEFERTIIDDDRMGILEPSMRQLAVEAAHHPDELLFDLINAAESTVCWDGQFFIDTDHSWGDSGSQDNDLTYNANDHDNVTSAEFLAALNKAVAAMLGFKNDQGKYMNRAVLTVPGNLAILLGPTLWPVANKALEAEVLSNDTNVRLVKPQLVVSPLYGSSVKFDLMNLGSVLKPYVFQKRSPLKFQMKGVDDIEEKTVKAMTEARYNVGYLGWWNVVRTTFN